MSTIREHPRSLLSFIVLIAVITVMTVLSPIAKGESKMRFASAMQSGKKPLKAPDVAAGRPASVPSITLVQTIRTEERISSLAFSSDGQILAAGGGIATVPPYGMVLLWRVSDWSILRTLRGHTDQVSSVAFSPDMHTLVSGSWDKTMRLWRVSDGRLLNILESNTGRISAVAFSPNGYILASGSDNATSLWGTSDGKLLRTLDSGTFRGASSVAFSPDGQTLGGANKLWRVSDGNLLGTLKMAYNNLVFSPDGAILATSYYDGTVRLWRVADGGLLRTLKPLPAVKYDLMGGQTQFAFISDGKMLMTMASGAWRDKGWYTTIRLWRSSDGRLFWSINVPKFGTLSMALSPDGNILAASGLIYYGGFQRSEDEGEVIRIWQVNPQSKESVRPSQNSRFNVGGNSTHRVNLPSHIRAQHRDVLQQWLSNKSGWRPATINDALAGTTIEVRESFLSEIKSIGNNYRYYSQAYKLQGYHPYYTVSDFNRDGIEDFAIIVINEGGGSIKLAVAVFNGPFSRSQNPAPTFYSEDVSEEDWLFWMTNDRFGYRFVLGPPNTGHGSRGFPGVIKPRGKAYVIER